MVKNLIYFCAFFDKRILDLLDSLLKSIQRFSNINEGIDLLLITTPDFKDKSNEIIKKYNLNCNIWTINLTTKFNAHCSRLNIFNYNKINSYSKILYIDIDVLITNDLNNLFNLQLEDKLYALKEGNTRHYFWGGYLFRKFKKCY